MRIFYRLATALALAIVSIISVASAQSMLVPFGIASHDTTQPVEIVSDRFIVSQNDGTAEFLGNVVVVQGELRLSAEEITAEYERKDEEITGKINRLIASGKVIFVSGEEVAEAQKAVYDLNDRTVELIGDVLMAQRDNTIYGQRVVANLDNGTAAIIGRVKTVFQAAGASE